MSTSCAIPSRREKPAVFSQLQLHICARTIEIQFAHASADARHLSGTLPAAYERQLCASRPRLYNEPGLHI